MQIDAARVGEANAKDILKVIEDLRVGGLKGRKPQLAGPCPRCGGDDRFWVDTRKNACGCRQCGGGGDPIGLVMFVREISFPDAIDWLCGPEQKLTPDEVLARAKQHEENEKAKAAKSAKFRAKAIARAREIWETGSTAEDSPVRDYLALRGITRDLLPRLPSCLRFHPSLPYMIEGAGQDDYVEIHRGPAMLAAVQGKDDRFCAVHRTWFDLAAPQGKLDLGLDAKGKPRKRKKGWGSKKGGAIRLIRGTSDTLVMGEGIETTFTGFVPQVWPEAHFWAGVDLGNMAGRRESGPGLKFAGIPDLEDDEAFVPPPWVKRLVYVMDGDSEPKLTRALLEAGLRRAMVKVPGLKGQIAVCPTGKDLNDLLMEGVRDE